MDQIRRLAMISLHTSPLEQPGTGDAGGMNVYVVEVAKRLAKRGIEVEIFTRATESAQPAMANVADGLTVRYVSAGPYEQLAKADLPEQLCIFAREVLRAEAEQPMGHYDVLHSHYWLSGQAGALARERWGVPLVHTMHTMAKVKNNSLAVGDTPEPLARVVGEEQIVEASDILVANTNREAKELIELYGADPARVEVIYPGVDVSVFRPTEQRQAREACGLEEDAHVIVFAGRLQPLKGPDVLVRAVAELLHRRPDLRSRLVVPIIGGPSGTGLDRPTALADLAAELGVDDVVRFVPPVEQVELATWYAAATVVAVPSHNESFGLVAVEAQAAGTPVVAAAVGGLTTVVRDEHSGLLVPGHDSGQWADALGRIVTDADLRATLAAGALDQALEFSWETTADQTVAVYQRARESMKETV